jgi:glutamate-ammonia-ligase adenylyltransferase
MQAVEEGKAETADGLQAVWLATADDDAASRTLQAAGYTAPLDALALLKGLREGSAYQALSAEGRARLDRLVPLLLKSASHCREPLTALGRVVHVLEAIGRRTTYLALMVENPPVLDQLVKLAGASPWIASWIAQHPIVLDELIDPRALVELPTRAQLADELRQRLAHIPEEDLELQMEVLREFRHGHVLRVAAADIGTALEATDIGRHLANIAEVLIEESLGLASRDLVRKHGRPAGEEPRFAVIGYGKLGSLELGYSSDLDIIFLYDAPPDSVTDGPRGLPAEQFYARLGQRLIHILTVRTPGGILYEVDMRLRPSGKSGPLVASLPAFREYQRAHAWTWEHQALVRARPIAGTPALRQAFGQVRHEILCQARDPQKLAAEVRDMRQRMLDSHGSKEAGQFDLKHDRGGIVDIEFMVQYGVLRWAHEHPVLARHTDNIHLLQQLDAEGLFRPAVVETLAGAYRRYLSIEHQLKLMERGSRVEPAELGDLPERVQRIWDEVIKN